MHTDRVENGFPVRYMSTQDGDRYVCIDPEEFDMSGWRVEVSYDHDHARIWPHEPTPYDLETTIEQFTRDDGFGISIKPWSAMVDWGRKIVRWIPPEEQA